MSFFWCVCKEIREKMWMRFSGQRVKKDPNEGLVSCGCHIKISYFLDSWSDLPRPTSFDLPSLLLNSIFKAEFIVFEMIWKWKFFIFRKRKWYFLDDDMTFLAVKDQGERNPLLTLGYLIFLWKDQRNISLGMGWGGSNLNRKWQYYTQCKIITNYNNIQMM